MINDKSLHTKFHSAGTTKFGIQKIYIQTQINIHEAQNNSGYEDILNCYISNIFQKKVLVICFNELHLVLQIQQTYTYSLITAASCGIILFVYYLFRWKISLLNHILALYQIYAVFFFSPLIFLVQNGQQVNRSFIWYYGLQCCFFYFAIYLQWTNFIYQSIMLCFEFILHQSDGDIVQIEGMINACIFAFMYILIIKIKYYLEKAKKENYLDYYQQRKWEEIVLQQLPMSIMLIGHQKVQDQLKLLPKNLILKMARI